MSTSPSPAQTHASGTPAPQPSALDAGAAKRAAWALYIIVLISGAVLMGVEIAGAKVLAPGFGTSQFVWGSIIGLFMAALAAGYYLGGMLADKRPSFGMLAAIVSAAGVLTVLIPRFGPGFCEKIAQMELGPTFGPLIAAAAIFFLPSFLMGMVSPYAVKLNASSLAGLGGVAGRLYALSTFGSIVGTLLTTFVLIPVMFLSNVLQMLGVLLLAAAAGSYLLFRSASGKLGATDRANIGIMVLIALAFAEAWIVLPVEPYLYPGQRMMHYEDSSYHEILVTEEVINVDKEGGYLIPPNLWKPESGGGFEVRRWLKFNENIESGIFPYRNEYKNAVNYTDLLHLPLMWVKDPKKVLVVGAGGGVVPTQYATWYGCEVDVAEIDKKVVDVAREYFQIPVAAKINFMIDDGRQVVRKMPDKSYDIIFLDAYSSGGQIPFHLLTWEFLAEVKSKLTDRGVLLTNIISGVQNKSTKTPPRPADLFLAEYKTLTASRADAKGDASDTAPLFSQVYIFPKIYPSRPMIGDAVEEYRNVIVIATRDKERRGIEDLSETIQALTRGEKPVIQAREMLWHVERLYKGPVKEELDTVPVLRDDYAPVDTMYRPVKRDENTRRLSL